MNQTEAEKVLIYRKDGTIEREEWRQEGLWHRAGAPAVVEYYSDGTIALEDWCWEGQLHRADGPARTFYRPDGTVEREERWEHGEWQGSAEKERGR